MNQSVFMELARKYGKSNDQIILCWHVQMRHVVIPESKNTTHIKDNINIFDLVLTDEDMQKIAEIHKNKLYNNFPRAMMAGLLLMRSNFDAQE